MTIGAIRSTGLTASRALAEWAASKLFPGETREEVDEPVMPAPGKIYWKNCFSQTAKSSASYAV